MFSDEDVQEITRLLPSQKVFASTSELPHKQKLPPLLPLASGHGLLTQQQALRALEDVITTESRRVSVSSLAHVLDIDESHIQTYVETSPLALFSQHRTDIIPRSAISDLYRELRELCAGQVVSKAAFSEDHDIEDVDSLKDIAREQYQPEEDLFEENDHIVRRAYQKEVEGAIQKALTQASDDAVPVDLSPSMLPGAPPLWFMNWALDNMLQQTSSQSRWHLEATGDFIRCTPKDAVARQSQAEVILLKNGDLPYIDLKVFSSAYSSLYGTIDAVIELLAPESEVEVRSPYAYSQSWFSELAGRLLRPLQTAGYVDITTVLSEHCQSPCIEDAAKILEQSLRSAWAAAPGTPNNLDQNNLRQAGDFVLTPARHDQEQTALLSASQSYAIEQWKSLQEDLGKEMVCSLQAIEDSLTGTVPLLKALMGDKEVRKAVEEQFWSEVSRLEAENESAFSTFWTDRVPVRVRVYTDGLEIIQDAKLKDQLSDLLATYIQKELLPESISKARAQGLVCSRKTKKNLQRFETISKSSKKGASELATTIERFSKKQGMAEPDSSSLAGAKIRLVQDMTRKLQKQSEGPLLFLTLVIILLARHQSGVVYATGKFAPKLLKHLKTSLRAEQYEQLELWKEGAKGSTLTPKDKAAMKQMASNV